MRVTMHLVLLTLTLCIFVTAGTTLQDTDLDFDSIEIHATDHEFASTCLRSCLCYRVPLTPGHSTVRVECHHLSNLPHITPRNTKSLVLHNSIIRRLDEASLRQQGLRFLEDFECSGCQIADVGPNAFRHLPKLKTIDLSNNSITDLRPDHFAAQTRMIVLHVTGNAGLDCGQLEKGLPKTRVLCDVVTTALPNVEEIVTVPTADYSLDDKVGDSDGDSRPTSPFASTDDTFEEGDATSGSYSWLTIGFFAGVVTGVIGVILMIGCRRHNMEACQGMPGCVGQEWMSLLPGRKVGGMEE